MIIADQQVYMKRIKYRSSKVEVWAGVQPNKGFSCNYVKEFGHDPVDNGESLK